MARVTYDQVEVRIGGKVVDGRQLDAFVPPSRVGGCIEVTRDAMLERLCEGKPVAWVAPGKAATVLHGWVAELVVSRTGDRAWRVRMVGGVEKTHAWSEAQVTRAIAGALGFLDPEGVVVKRTLRNGAQWHGTIHLTARGLNNG